MNNVNKTLYIPLYGKSYVSKKGVILRDEKAEEIWRGVEFPLKGKSKSKWLAYYLGMRAAVFDAWTREKIDADGECVVLQLGCGLDSRALRVGAGETLWYDVDFPAVIEERRQYYQETEIYRMLGADITQTDWLQQIPKTKRAVVIMEGVSMYLPPEQIKDLFASLSAHFSSVSLLVDCYTTFAAKMTRIKNPIREVGVSKVYGFDAPKDLVENSKLRFLQERSITPTALIEQLKGLEKNVFKTLYAGATSKKLYKLYEYES